jgi:hypothetical protein
LENVSDMSIISFSIQNLFARKTTFLFTKMHVIGTHAFLALLPSNKFQENLPCFIKWVELLNSYVIPSFSLNFQISFQLSSFPFDLIQLGCLKYLSNKF